MALLLSAVASSTHALTLLLLQIHRQVQRASPARKRGREPDSSLVGQCPRQRRVSRLPCALLPAPPLVCPPRRSYLPVAQNGFVNLPRELKIDAGYYGSGFYFTRYPRCCEVGCGCARAAA